MANITRGGFRFRKHGSNDMPVIRVYPVADDYATAIFTGDVIKQVSTGYAEAAAAGDTNILGVCAGVKQYWTGSELRPGNYLPASTSYDTNLERQSLIYVYVASPNTIFEVDADDGVTATTEAGFLAFFGENCDITASAGDTTTGVSGHCLDISSHVATAAQCRIHRLAPLLNQDFASDRVKLEVSFNESHLYTTAGV